MKKGNIKSIIVKTVVIAFLIYVIITAILLNIDISKRNDNLLTVQGEIAKQQIFNDEIEHILNSDETSEYVIRIAREKFGFVFPDERIYVDISGK